MKKTTTRNDGFSIVEMIVTLAIIGIAVSITMSIYALSSRLSDRSTDLLEANQIVYTKLQAIENEPFADIPVVTRNSSGTITDGTKYHEDFSSSLPASLPKPHEGKVYISYIEGSTTLKYIFVRVKYGQNQIVEYGSLIQEGGIGR